MKHTDIKIVPDMLAIPPLDDGPVPYALSLAASLILCARKEPSFARTLARKSAAVQIQKSTRIRSLPYEPAILMPPDEEAAVRRMEWFFTRAKENMEEDNEKAMALLAAWRRTHESPKQQIPVIGTMLSRIPVVGMGRVKKRKKKMNIIIRRSSPSHEKARDDKKEKVSDIALIHAVHRASLEVFACGVAIARDDIGRLEPELADWFYGDRELKIYAASEQEFTNIQKELSGLGIPCAASSIDEKHSVLAVTPAIHHEYPLLHWDVTAIS